MRDIRWFRNETIDDTADGDDGATGSDAAERRGPVADLPAPAAGLGSDCPVRTIPTGGSDTGEPDELTDATRGDATPGDAAPGSNEPDEGA